MGASVKKRGALEIPLPAPVNAWAGFACTGEAIRYEIDPSCLQPRMSFEQVELSVRVGTDTEKSLA